MTAPISRVAIAGSGPIPWIAASALARAFHHRRIEIMVVETEAPRDAPAGRWTLPSQRGMHGLLGLPEGVFMRRTGATFKLASEHSGWQGEGSRFLHAHGDIGTDLGGSPFYKLLIRQALAGRAESPESYSLAAVAARLGRFARPMGEESALTSSFTYAYHLEERPYVELLREHAARLGVRRVNGRLSGVTVNDGNITALSADGETINADYFIDCTGPDAQLMSRVSANEREDWSLWLPADRMVSALAPPIPNAAAVTRTVARVAGWSWSAPLANASLAGYVYSSAHLSDDAALADLESFTPGVRAAQLCRFASGRRRRFWERNCIALGGAAVELEPLAGADLHLAQLGIATLIELFPLDTVNSVEGAEYNRVMAEHADSLRDFTLAHYRAGKSGAGRASGGDFWAATRAAELPARLAEKLELFAANGRINMFDQESFEEVDWAWLLLGAGCIPAALELQIDARLAKVKPEQVAPLRGYIEQLAASMPPHSEYVQRQTPHAR